MTVNTELLDQVMEHIELNQELWDQGHWAKVIVNGYSADEIKGFILEDPKKPACDTAMCLAGRTCALQGWQPVFEAYNVGRYGDTYSEFCENDDGDRARIKDKAREMLGLDGYTASKLFDGSNDLERLRLYVGQIKENGTLRPADVPDVPGSWCNVCNGPCLR